MAWRLPHVLVLMALLLAAGVLSVRAIPDDSFVQGTLVVSVPDLTPELAQRLQSEHPGARWVVLPAGDGPLAPFDDARVEGLATHGTAVSLFIQPPHSGPPAESWRPAWRVVLAPESGDVVASLVAFVRAQTGTRPFLAGLILPSGDDGRLSPLVGALLDAGAALPAYRRTTLVLLGERQPQTGGRVVVRLDTGAAARSAPVTLTDVLEPEGDR